MTFNAKEIEMISFNTEDGIGRATTCDILLARKTKIRFNTEDGIGRATT